VCEPFVTLCIKTAVESVDEGMLRCVWNELDYRIDICRVTKGSHMEHLYLSHTNLKTYYSTIQVFWLC
jgi:hypothetical protein